MPTATFIESGTAATQDTKFYSATTGTVASATDQVHTGSRSLKLSTGAGPTTATAQRTGVLADAGRRISFWFRLDTTPTTVDAIAAGLTTGAANVFQIRVTTANKLQMQPLGPTAVTGTTVLSLNTWYRVSCAYTITDTTHFSFQLFLNGSLEASVTTGTLTRTGTDQFRFTLTTNFGANANVWFSDVYIDDSAALTDTGDISVTAKRPNANGTTNDFTTQIGSGGSGYGTGHSPQVNEQPLSITNGWSFAVSGVAKTEEYNVEGVATGDVDITGLRIADYMGWVYCKALNAETGQIVVNNVTSNISITTSAALFTQIAGSTTYPAGTGTDIGLVTATTTTTVSLYECGIIVAYAMPLTRTASDTLTFSDTGARVATLARAPSDTLTFTDSADRSGSAFNRAGSDTLTTSDAATRQATLLRGGSDTLTTSDSATRTGTFQRAGADTLTFSDLAARALSLFRSVADTLTFSDSGTAQRTYSRSANDSLSFTDAAVRQLTLNRTGADTLTTTDAGTRQGTFIRSPSDALTFSDTANRNVTLNRTASDTLTLSSIASRVVTLFRSAADSLGLSDIANAVVSFITAIGGFGPRGITVDSSMPTPTGSGATPTGDAEGQSGGPTGSSSSSTPRGGGTSW